MKNINLPDEIKVKEENYFTEKPWKNKKGPSIKK
jgi:hypothetical protein